MADPVFRARTAPILPPEAQALVNAYEATYGASAPGCCPAALAAVLDHLAADLADKDDDGAEVILPDHVLYLAAQLRGQES